GDALPVLFLGARRSAGGCRAARAGGAECRAEPGLRPAARGPGRERAAAYRTGGFAAVVGADLYADRRRHAVRVPAVRDALSLGLRAKLAAGANIHTQSRARPRGRRGPRRRRDGGPWIAAVDQRRRDGARLDRS